MSSHHHQCQNNIMLHFRFFKAILKTNLQRIKIPNKFSRRHGSALSNPVFLKPPDGTLWKVYWTKKNSDEVWFVKGWKEFTKNYSLNEGHLVVFKYEETSQFDVIILEINDLEIDYSKYETVNRKGKCDQRDEKTVGILKEIPVKNNDAGKRLTLFSPQPHMKVRGESSIRRRTSSLNWPKELKAQEIAQKFISYNPFFTLFIKPSYLTEYQVNVPTLKGYIEDKVKDVALKVGERQWQVKLLPCRNSARRLSGGWSLFVHENGLQAEDVCVFELINMEDSVFKVHVFKR
ncbi:hypothetical protein HN51_044981 [Arachis hypogaea]|uniref:B3 domain-containing transcription factor VRN1-like n=1 Tax=Arachis ipaensis TaxID=130454 RepID=UPI0007AF6196|nr:B3 domain-containing transcription factor VRN1-like [Arachis ipaensis]XP_025674133.1 B3 domain-containing transcription factor VRN1 [Arachis hypogaea]QHN97279.1 B3 domain-containing transcription factor [Arachis hypogaea]